MAVIDVLNIEGKQVAQADLPEAVFNVPVKSHVLHEVVTMQLANRRNAHPQVKHRGDVAGSTRKLYKQKGTGRARAGTSRSPLWRTGGKIFAARPRDYTQKINRKMYRLAMCSILSELVRQERLVAVESFGVEAAKTRELAGKLKQLGLDNVLIVTDAPNDKLYLAARNLPHVAVCVAAAVDPVSLVGFDKVVVTTAALKQIEERLA